MPLERVCDELRERKSRTDVRDPDRIGAEALRGEPLALDRADERAIASGVRVVDVRVRDEGVQQRLDRGAGHRRVDLAASEVRDHVLVGHLVALDQGMISCRRRPVNPVVAIVARSLPEPFTQSVYRSWPA